MTRFFFSRKQGGDGILPTPPQHSPGYRQGATPAKRRQCRFCWEAYAGVTPVSLHIGGSGSVPRTHTETDRRTDGQTWASRRNKGA